MSVSREEAQRAGEKAKAKAKGGNSGAAPPEQPDPEAEARRLAEHARAQIISWPALSGRKAPPRCFLLPEWIPASCVTLLHGFGGVGKSLLAQQIGTAAAFQHELLGGTADACPVLAWWGEDDRNEIWRRQEHINAALGIDSIADLEGKVIWRPCPGDDITLFSAANESDFTTTPEFRVLREQILDLKVRLGILDSATQIAAIPENNRPLVTRCLQALTKICLEAPTTILLIGHNNRAGDFSGSSAWENRARARAHMKRDKNKDGSETIKLCRPKANYAGIEDGVTLEWHAGTYRCTDHRFETYGDRLERECRDRQIDQAFLDAVDRLTEQRRALSASKQATNYAPKVIVASGAATGLTQRDLEKAMNRLFADGQILAQVDLWRRGNRTWVTGLGRKP
jgi:RecA-family ATPase